MLITHNSTRKILLVKVLIYSYECLPVRELLRKRKEENDTSQREIQHYRKKGGIHRHKQIKERQINKERVIREYQLREDKDRGSGEEGQTIEAGKRGFQQEDI